MFHSMKSLCSEPLVVSAPPQYSQPTPAAATRRTGPASTVDKRLLSLLPDDLLRISSEDVLLSRAALRIKSAASDRDNTDVPLRDALANEIAKKLQLQGS